jgi:hypothetical protein
MRLPMRDQPEQENGQLRPERGDDGFGVPPVALASAWAAPNYCA